MLFRSAGLETWRLKPRADVEEEDRWSLRLQEGTKGKRLRYVPITTDAQRELLDRAIHLVGANSLMPQSYRIDQWKNHYYYVTKTCGITPAIRMDRAARA